MEVQLLPLTALVPYARNPRRNQAAVAKVAASIQEFGFKQPLVVDRDHVIIAGHTRFLAAQQLGLTQVPVIIATDLTPTRAKAYRLADNRASDEATWDNDLLVLELEDLQQAAFNLELTGFNVEEIQALTALIEAVEKGLIAADHCPDVATAPRCKVGEVWLLGRHRLLCGDATCTAAIEKLLAGQKAAMGFTDPPYNVNYQGATRPQPGVTGDAMEAAPFTRFLEKLFTTLYSGLQPNASLYVCHASLNRCTFQHAVEASGFTVRSVLIWAKHHFSWGHCGNGRYKFQHEPILYCHRNGESDVWYGDKSQSTLWPFAKPAANRLHPTMKPVALIEKAIVNSSRPGDSVLDVCAGSGSTVIACEKTARTAYCMEIDPHHCDGIIRRWEAFTGQTAIVGTEL